VTERVAEAVSDSAELLHALAPATVRRSAETMPNAVRVVNI
jgi:hypothetical protein